MFEITSNATNLFAIPVGIFLFDFLDDDLRKMSYFLGASGVFISTFYFIMVYPLLKVEKEFIKEQSQTLSIRNRSEADLTGFKIYRETPSIFYLFNTIIFIWAAKLCHLKLSAVWLSLPI